MSSFFIRRPIVAIVIAILFVVGGAVMVFRLPVAQFPEVAPPQIETIAMYTGADALTVEQSVATPIDAQVNGAKRMLYMQAISGNDGTMTLQVSFETGTDIDIDQVRSRTAWRRRKPTCPRREQLRRHDHPDGRHPAPRLHDQLAEQDVGPELPLELRRHQPQGRARPRSGIGQVKVFGAANYAMRVWVAPDTIANMGLTVTDLVNAIAAQNVVNPAGTLGGEPAPPGQAVHVHRAGAWPPDERRRSSATSSCARTRTDRSCRLKDVARLELGAENYTQQAYGNGVPATLVGLYQVPGSNALEAANRAKATMARLAEKIPSDMNVALTLDTTVPVTEGAKEIVITLLEAIGLVILVVFVFLQNWRATLIPILTIPVSLVGTFVFFPMMGFSTNTLSAPGARARGRPRRRRRDRGRRGDRGEDRAGLSPRDAALQAMEEVSGALVGIALVLSSVFIPPHSSPASRARSIAVRAHHRVLGPHLRLQRAHAQPGAWRADPPSSGEGRAPRTARTLLRRLRSRLRGGADGLRPCCGFLIRKVVVALVLLVAFTALAGGLGKILPTSFMPQEDQGFFFMNVQLPEAASMQRTNAVMRKIDEIVKAEPGVHYVNAVSGYSLLSQTASPRNGLYFVQLEPYEERATRELQSDAIVASLNRKLYGLPEAQAFAFLPPAIPGVGQAGGVDVFIQDRAGNTVDYLWQNTQRFMAELQKRPEIAFMATTYAPAVPQLFAHVDQDRVLKLGVPIQDVYTTLQAFLGGAYVNQFNRFGRVWRVFLQADPLYRTRSGDLSLFYVRNQKGEAIPLSTLVSLEKSSGPEYSNRFNEYRAIEVIAIPAAGYSSGQAMAAVAAVTHQVLPADMGYAWNGMSYQESIAGSGAAVFALSLLIVFLILAALYESWSLPWSVLLSTPVAVCGAFVGIWARGLENNVYAQIGLLMLIGLSAKNAILIVEFAKAELENGASIVDAALEGARKRLRPILMTSFAFILGLAPLWNALGAGGVARQVIGTVTIVGMAFATSIAIFLVPVLFVLVERLSHRGRRDAAEAAPVPPSTVPAPQQVTS
jgi:HAE1 family hydrophobic/amphiphilic exporter-1